MKNKDKLMIISLETFKVEKENLLSVKRNPQEEYRKFKKGILLNTKNLNLNMKASESVSRNKLINLLKETKN